MILIFISIFTNILDKHDFFFHFTIMQNIMESLIIVCVKK